MAGGGSNLGNYSGNWGDRINLGAPSAPPPSWAPPQTAGGNKAGGAGGVPKYGSPGWIKTHPDYSGPAPAPAPVQGPPKYGSPGWISTHPDYQPQRAPAANNKGGAGGGGGGGGPYRLY